GRTPWRSRRAWGPAWPAVGTESAPDLVPLGECGGRQLQRGGGDVLAQVLDRRRAGDQQDVRRPVQQPRERDRVWGRLEPLGHRLEGVGLQRREAAEREVGDERDALARGELDERVVLAVGEVVVVLHADDGGDRPGL